MTPQQYKLIELEDLLPKVSKFEELKEELEDFVKEQFIKQYRKAFKIGYIDLDHNGREFTIETDFWSWQLSEFLKDPQDFIKSEMVKHKDWIDSGKQQRIDQARRDLESAQKYLEDLLQND